MEKISNCIKLADLKKESIRKSFDQAYAQASSILSLTLQWKDLENHIELAKDSLLKLAHELDLQAKKIAEATEVLDQRDQELEIKSKKVQKRYDELQIMEKHLDSVKERIRECTLELSSKEKQLNLARKKIEDCNGMLSMKRKELALVQNEHEECGKELSVKRMQLGTIERSIDECTGKLKSEEKKLSLLEVKLEECCKDLSVKTEQLESVQKSLQICSEELRAREMEVDNVKLVAIDCDEELELKQKDLFMLKNLISDCDSELESKQKQLEVLEELTDLHSRELDSRVRKLSGIEKSIDQSQNELVLKKKEFDATHKSIQECLKELDLKKEELSGVQKLIEESSCNLYLKEKHLDSIKVLIEENIEVLESKEKQNDAINTLINRCSAELSMKQKHLDSIKVLIRESSEELEAKQKQCDSLNDCINKCSEELTTKQTELKSSSKLRSEEKKLEFLRNFTKQLTNKVESKEKDLNSLNETMKKYREDLELKEREFNAIRESIRERDAELAFKEKLLKSVEISITKSNEELEAMKEQQSSIVKSISESSEELEAKKKNLDLVGRSLKERCEELTLKEAELESMKRMTCGFQKELEEREKFCESLKRTLEERLEKLEMKEGQFEVCTKELELREQQIEEREKRCDSLTKTFEERLEKLETKERLFKVSAKELELREQLIDSMRKSVDERSKQVEMKEKQLNDNFHSHAMIGQPRELMANSERETSNSFSTGYKCCIPENGSYLQFLLNENLRKHDLVQNEVFTAIQKSPDPAKLVLDAMQGFYSTTVEKGDKEFDLSVIRRSCNILLGQLLRISPQIKPKVREEAINLALEWKSRMRAVSEKSLEVLGFLQLLAAYKLASFFNHDELQTFLDTVSQHGQALELRRALRFAESIPVTSVPAPSVRVEHIDHLQVHSVTANIQSGAGIDESTSPVILWDNMDDHDLTPREVLAALQLSPDPAKFVLGVIQGSYSQHCQNAGAGLDASVVKSKILLLEQLIKVSPVVSPTVKEEAMKLAVFWKANVRLENEKSVEVWAFLLFLAIYGLVSYFEVEEILRLVLVVANHRHAPNICRALGFTTKIPELIQILITRKQYVEAARFSCAFGLVRRFPPQTILQKCLEHIRGGAQDKAIDRELNALKAILQCISDYKLEFLYSTQNIMSRITELEKQRASSGPSSSAATIDISGSKGQPSPAPFLQQHIQNQNFRDGLQLQVNSKRPRTDVSDDRSLSSQDAAQSSHQ